MSCPTATHVEHSRPRAGRGNRVSRASFGTSRTHATSLIESSDPSSGIWRGSPRPSSQRRCSSPASYRALGVDVAYLPVHGRGFFLADTLPRDRPIDVLFLGTLTPERRSFLAQLREELGPSVTLVARDDVRDPGELRALVSSAKLGLSCGTLTDAITPAGLLRSESVTERVFDYPLAGTPVLSDERAHLSEVLVEGEEVFVYRDVNDAGGASASTPC